MTQFKKQLAGALATGLLVANMLAPVAYAGDNGINFEESGNGAESKSAINAAVANTTVVKQSNTASVTNNSESKANSGGNDANYNTGGDVFVKTGKATSDVEIANKLNTNVAKIKCCEPNSTDVKVSGNGYMSENDVNLSQANTNAVEQENDAKVLNDVDSKANSGWNDANYNTGGDVTVLTGPAHAGADVYTHANTNLAQIGGGHQGGNDGGVSLLISGNGAESDNDISLALYKANSIAQANVANVTNDVDAKANSGKNDANSNTGGEVAILTGKADAHVGVDNELNFNWADIDCGCVTDLSAKIAGNGYDSENEINASLANTQAGAQDNLASLLNEVDAKAKTGYNDAKYNTGDPGDDPAVMTGDAQSNTWVENSSNWNVFGDGNMLPNPMPEVDFDFDFDWSGFMSWWAFHSS